MKFVLTLLGFFICLSYARAQDSEVLTIPAAVSDLFTLLYPDAKSIEWHLTGDHYKAEFKNNKMETMALMDAAGTLLQTCTEIKSTALPETALSLLADKFAEEKIDQAMITENAKGVITFTAVIDKADYTFDATGQLMASHTVVLNAQEKAQ
jgi:hypothetical protein